MTQTHFKIATIGLLVLLPILVVAASIFQQPIPELESLPTVSTGAFGGRGDETDDALEQVQEDSSRLTLRVGMIGATPPKDELVSIPNLPVTEAEVRRAYVSPKAIVCRLRPPGGPVKPILADVPPGRAGTLGFLPVLEIALELDSNGREKLPKITQSGILDYFEKHKLLIQAELHADAEGKLYFGTETYGAFYESDRTSITVESEPMIGHAVDRFHVLGIVGSPKLGMDSGFGRTLALAFEFAEQDATVTNVSSTKRTTLEWMLLHLEEGSSASKYRINVFISDDQRTTLHLLQSIKSNENPPELRATVRFDKLILMGMYPIEPVVTDAQYSSEGVLDLDVLTRLSSASEDESMSVTEILDQFERLSQSESSTTMSSADRQIELIRQRKQREIERMRMAPPVAEDRVKGVKLMSGLGETKRNRESTSPKP